jgi:LacI family transcriptional regulator
LVKKPPTVRDVAAATGLSTYTVSRALGGADGVSAQSRERVRKAAAELGYVANRAAQDLRRNPRSSVTVITASTSNYYYIDLMTGVQRTLRAGGRSAVIADIAVEGVYDNTVEDTLVRQIIQSRTVGVISTLTLTSENARLLREWEIPMVFVDSDPPDDQPDVAAIRTDNFAASITVGQHLAEHGFRRWLFVAYPPLWSTRRAREHGLRHAAEQCGADMTVLETVNDPLAARQTVSDYLKGQHPVPDVVIAGDNPILHGILHTFTEIGLRVPDDIALVGYDEFPWAAMLRPPLTVLNEDSAAIGVKAAEILSRIIDEQIAAERQGKGGPPTYLPTDRQEVGSALIIRESCGCRAPDMTPRSKEES